MKTNSQGENHSIDDVRRSRTSLFVKRKRMGKTKNKCTSLAVCEECVERPAFLSEDDLKLHKLKFHDESSVGSSENPRNDEGTSQGIVRGLRKTAKRISELMGSKRKLKQQLKDTKEEVSRLDTLAGTQENTVRLLKEEVKNLERRYVAKNLEIAKLSRSTHLLYKDTSTKERSDGGKERALVSNAETFRKTIDANFLCLMDSMKNVTGQDFDFQSTSTESHDENVIREGHSYKRCQLGTMVRQINTLQSEVKGLQSLKQNQEYKLTKETSARDDIFKSAQDAKEKLLEKSRQVEECKGEIYKLREQIANQKVVIENITKESTKYQEKYKIFKLKTMESEQKVAQLHGDVSKLSTINLSMEESIQELRVSLTSTKNKMIEKERSVKILTQTEKVLQLKIKRMVIEMDEKELVEAKKLMKEGNSKRQMQLKIEELEHEQKLVAKTNEKFQGHIKEAAEKEDVLNRQIKALQQDKAVVTRERNNLKRQMEAVKRKQQETQSAMKKLQELSDELGQENKKIQSEKMNLKRELWALKDSVGKVKKEQAKKHDKDRAEIIAELETRKENIQGIRVDLESAAKCHQQEGETMRVENERLREKISARDTKMHKMKTESEHIQDGLLRLVDQLKEKHAHAERRVTGLTACREEIVKTATGTNKTEAFVVEKSIFNDTTMLQSEIAKLKEDLEQSRSTASEQENKFNKVKVLHQKLDSELIRVSNVKLELEEEYCTLKAEQELTRKDRENLISQLDASAAELRKTSSELQDTKKSYDEVLSKLSSSEKETMAKIAQLESTIKRLQQESLNAKERIQAEEKENQHLQKLLEESEAKLEKLSQNLQHEITTRDFSQNQHAEVSKLKEEISRARADKEKLMADFKDCEKERNTLKQRIETTPSKGNAEISKMRSQLQKNEKEKDEAGRKLNESLTSQTALASKVEQLTLRLVSLDNLKKDLENIQSEKKELKTNLDQSLQDQKCLQSKFDEIVKSSEPSVKEDVKTKELQNRLEECLKEKQQLKIDLDESLAAQRTVKTKLDEKEDCSSADDLNNLREQLAENEREKHQLKIELEESLAARRTLESKLEEAQDDTTSNSENNITDWEERLAECEQGKHQLKIELEESEAAKRALEQKLEEVEDGGCDGDVEQLQKEKESMQQELDKNKKLLDFQKKNRDSDYKEIQTLKSQLEDARKKLKKVTSDLTEAKKKATVDSDASSSSSSESEKAALEKEIREIKANLQKTKEELEGKDRKCVELSGKIFKVVQNENETAVEQRNTKQQLRDAEKELKKCKTEIEELKVNLESKGGADDSKEAGKGIIAGFENDIEELKEEIEDLEEEVKEKNEKITEYLNAIDKEKRQVVTLKKEIESNKKQLEGKAHLEKELGSLKSKLRHEQGNSEHNSKREEQLLREKQAMFEDLKDLRAQRDSEVEEMGEEILAIQREYHILQEQMGSAAAAAGGGQLSNAERNILKRSLDDERRKSQQLEDENFELKKQLEEMQRQQNSKTEQHPNGNATHVPSSKSENAESINWSSAYRSYHKEDDDSDKKADEHFQPHLDGSDESLDLRIPTQLSRFGMHANQNSEEEEYEEEEDYTKGNPELTAMLDSITYADLDKRRDDSDSGEEGNVSGSYGNNSAALQSYYQQQQHHQMQQMQYAESPYDFDEESFYKATIKQHQQQIPPTREEPMSLPTNNDKAATGDKKGKKKKTKKKEKAAENKPTLAPLGGALPPLRGNGSVNKVTIPPIGGAQAQTPQKLPKKDKPTAAKKKVAFATPNHNPLDAKPLPCLLNPNYKSEQAVFMDKYSPAVKKLGPVKPMPGGPRPVMQPYHQGNNGHVQQQQQYNHFMHAVHDEYTDGQEDVGAIMADLDRTNAELSRIQGIQSQFY